MRNDLEAVGVPASDVAGYKPRPSRRRWWATTTGPPTAPIPCSVLGMLYTLEVIASVYGGPFASAIKESLLLEGERGVSFINSHATMDAEHMADLRKILVTVNDAPAQDAIVDAALLNFHHFTRIIEQV